MMKLYVGNLPYSFSDEDLQNLFTSYDVKSAKVIIDRASGRSKGFGFVELSSKEEGLKAIEELDKKEIEQRAIIVNEARPQEKREHHSNSFNKRRY